MRACTPRKRAGGEARDVAEPAMFGGKITFEIDPFKKHCLLNGLDDIGLTMQKAPKIDTYEDRQKSGQPWLYDTETV